MLPEPHLFLLLVLVGGWAGIDGIAAGQFMVSRPVVAATAGGLVVGDPASGALLGLILEALNLTVLPVGAARYPEMGPAAVAAGAVLAGGPWGTGALLTSVLFALGWAWISAWSVRQIRHVNIRLMEDEVLREGSPDALERRHLASIGLDFVRAGVLTAAGILVLAGALHLTVRLWALPEPVGEVALWSVVVAGIAASLRLFGERRAPLFAVGLACGVLLLVLL